MHHYPFHVGDYIRATAHLDLIEDCVYRRLIDLYMETEKPIPNETQQVIRRLRLGSSGLILESILQEFFTLEADNCWHNSRCDGEIREFNRLAEISRINGKLGGRPKKTQQVVLDNPEITQNEPVGLQPIPSTQYPKDKTTSNVTVAVLLADGCSEIHANELLSLRKKKRSPLTALAWNGIKGEIKKAGMSLDEGIGTMAARGWQSFEAAWVAQGKAQLSTVVPTQARTCTHCKEPAHMEISGRWYCRNHDQYSTSEAA